MPSIGNYYRADRTGKRVWSTSPGRYGLYIIRPGSPLTPECMAESSDTLEPLLKARAGYKPWLWAVVLPSQRVPAFEEEAATGNK
jgi:hypothetical protein